MEAGNAGCARLHNARNSRCRKWPACLPFRFAAKGATEAEVGQKSNRKEFIMPTISMFYGILILMYFYDDKKHHRPHIHAEYGEHQATIAIEDGAVLGGSLPHSKMKLVQAWIEIHREDLMANWKLAVAGEPVFRIEPLK